MSSLPLQVDLSCKAAIVSNSKLSYLEKTYAMLEQQYEDLQQSYQTNKNMLDRTLESMQALQLGSMTLDDLKKYGEECQRVLQERVVKLEKRLQGEQKARKQEASQLLICQQIREEQARLHQQILTEYQAKILDLRFSIQEKQRHIQMLQSAQVDMANPNQSLRLPSREALKIVQEHNLSQIIIERYKEENEQLWAKLKQQQQKTKDLQKQLSHFRISSNPRQVLSSKNSHKAGNTRCRSISNIKTKNVIQSPGSTQSSTDNQQKPKQKQSFKKNQTLFQCVVALYKKQKLNTKMMSKKMKEMQDKLLDMANNQQLLIDSNKTLTAELVNLRKLVNAKQKINKADKTIKSCQRQPINSDKTFDRLFHERKNRGQARKIELHMLKSMFKERVMIMQTQIINGLLTRKATKSNSWSELPAEEIQQEQPAICEEKKDISLLIDGDFSRIMQQPTKCKKPVTFAEFFGQTTKNESFLDVFRKDE